MGECSALATKAELRAVEAKIDRKIDKTKEPEIVQAGATLGGSIGASIAIGTLSPEIRALLGQLGALASKVGTLAARVLDLFGKFAGVLSIIGLLATAAQLMLLQNDVRQLKNQLRQVSNIAEGAVVKADIAINRANTATNTANAATREANIAVDKANQAINSANRAEVDAEGARSEANQAIIKANGAISLASTARNEASQASSNANQAIRESNVAKSQANQAIRESNIAKTEARDATGKANTATAKANEAIANSEQNEAVIQQVKQENNRLRAELFGIKFAQSLIDTELNRQQKELANQDRLINQAVVVGGVTKKYVDQRDGEIESKFIGSSGVTATTVKTMIEGAIKEEDKSIKDYIAGLPGIGTGTGTKGDGLTVGEVRDIAKTEAGKAVKELERVQDRQYADLKNGINALPGVIGGVVVGGIVTGIKPFGDSINKTVAQTSAPAITQAAAAGVCQTAQPGGCMNNLSNNQSQNIRDFINAAGTAASAANNALLLRMQGLLNAINATTTTIKGTTDAISKTVHSAKHGLNAIQDFAKTAWQTTQADKVLSIVNTALNIHNAVMLSNNIGRSMAYIANNTLQAFGIKDATSGDAIDVGSLVRGKINSMLDAMLGATQAASLRRQFAAYNRIYQAGANVLYSVRSIMDSAYDMAETTGENVSQIGNALKKAGAVRENAYKLMPTDFRSTSRVQRRLEKVGNVADSLEQITGDAVSLTEEVKEMKANKKEFDDELKKATDEQTKGEIEKKKEATNNPEAKEEDEIRALPKDDPKQ